MAKVKARKKNQHAYSPTTPGFPSQKAFNQSVRRRAGAQIRPEIQDVNQRLRDASGAHKTRNQELMQWYGFDKGARESEQSRLSGSMQSILGGVSGMGGDVQAGLAAALRQAAAGNDVAASQLGVSAPGIDPALAQSIAARSGGNDMSLAGLAANLTAASAADVGLSGVEGRTAGEQEGARYKTLRDTLSKERTGVRARLPDIIEQMRAASIQEQLAMEQQGLAEDQFGEQKVQNKHDRDISDRQTDLAEDQFGETQRQNNRQYRIDRGNLKLAGKQLQADIDKAAGTTGEEHAKARAAKFDAAAQFLDGLMKPGEADYKYNADGKKVVAPKKWRSNRNFGSTYTTIQRRFGMGPNLALRVMLLSPIPEWRKKAAAMLANNRRENQGAAGPPTPE